MEITVVIPALDEQEGIGHVLSSLPRARLRAAGHRVRVLVVDGGSRDRTRELAEAAGAQVLHAPRGYGRQYRAGFAAAPAGLVVTMDADGTYPADLVPELVDHLLRQDLDFLSVDRFAGLQAGSMSALHRFGNRVLTLVTRVLFGVRVRDSQSGMWVFRREILPRLHLVAHGMAFSEEIKIEAWRHARAAEVPGRYAPRRGHAKLRSYRDGLGNLAFLFMKRFYPSCSAIRSTWSRSPPPASRE